MFGVGVGHQVQRTVYSALDSFTRANNNTSLTHAQSGQLWNPDVGVWGIENQRARVFSATPTSAVALASIETGLLSKAIVSSKFYFDGEYIDQRLLFRYVDGLNHLFVRSQATRYEVMRRVAGSVATVANINVTPVNGDKVSIRMNGSTIEFFINGTIQLTITETSYLAATKAAMGQFTNNYPVNSTRFDDFKAVKL